jgi:hypothetical protein
VSIIGTNVAQSLAGLSQAERLEAKDKKPAPKEAVSRPKRQDDQDMYVAQTEGDDAVRRMAGNEQEEASEDHKEHNAYTPGGTVDGEARPKLDVEG